MRRIAYITRAAPAVLIVCAMAAAPAFAAQDAARPGKGVALASFGEANPEALYAEGCAHLQGDDPKAAVKPLTEAVARCPGNVNYAMKLAEAHALGSDWPAVGRVLAPLENRLESQGLLLLAEALAKSGGPGEATAILERGLERWPESEALWVALIDRALDSQQCGSALRKIDRARRRLGPSAQLNLRAAQAYYRLGQVLGAARVMELPEGRPGQFVGRWLVVEPRGTGDRYLCCPEESALYTLRRALDAGLDEPAAHLLHARIWQEAGRPEVGLAILRSREALLLECSPREALSALMDLSLSANALDDYLRYARLLAEQDSKHRSEILYGAYLEAAERYNQRGDAAMYRGLLRRALVLKPDNVDLMLQLADAVWNAGARADAAIWYRRVLEHQPVHAERSRILRRLEE